MIDDRDLGQMLNMFALSYSDPLFATSLLPVENRALFRRHCREAILACEDARYDEDVVAWIFDWDGAARRFLSSYAAAATAADLEALRAWIDLGFNGIYTPDLRLYLWDRALHWARRHEAWTTGLAPQTSASALAFLHDVARARRADDHLDLIENVRDHADRLPSDIAIKRRTRIPIHDDFVDPLLLFTCMRGQFLLVDAVRRSRDDRPLIEALNRIPHAWHAAEASSFPDHDTALILERPFIEDVLRPSGRR